MKTCSCCKAEKPFADFNKYKRSKDGYDYRCKLCQRASNKAWCNNNWSRKISQQRDRCLSLRDQMRDLKESAGCATCDETDPVCLEFHHLDPSVKEIDPSDMISSGWSWSRMLKEIDKCIVLCSNCHKKVHAGKICLVS